MSDRDSVTALVQSVSPYLNAFRPLLGTEEGSSGRRLEGTVTLVEDGNDRFLLTAHHAVKAPTPYYFGVRESGEIRWPTEKSAVLVPALPGLPDADVAVVHSGQPPLDGSLSGGVPAALLGVTLEGSTDTAFVAVGYPSSKGKLRMAERRLDAKSMYALVEFVPPHLVSLPSFDPRVQMCFKYSQEGRASVEGAKVVGAHPRGMSGGGVFAIGQSRASGSLLYAPFLVGILTEFHESRSLLVATRVRCIFEALGLFRPRGDLLYRAAGA